MYRLIIALLLSIVCISDAGAQGVFSTLPPAASLWEQDGDTVRPRNNRSVTIGTISGVTTEQTVYQKYSLDSAGSTVETVRFTVQLTDNTAGAASAVFKIYQLNAGTLECILEGTP